MLCSESSEKSLLREMDHLLTRRYTFDAYALYISRRGCAEWDVTSVYLRLNRYKYKDAVNKR